MDKTLSDKLTFSLHSVFRSAPTPPQFQCWVDALRTVGQTKITFNIGLGEGWKKVCSHKHLGLVGKQFGETAFAAELRLAHVLSALSWS